MILFLIGTWYWERKRECELTANSGFRQVVENTRDSSSGSLLGKERMMGGGMRGWLLLQNTHWVSYGPSQEALR